MSQTMKPKHFGFPPLRRHSEATAAKPVADGLLPSPLGEAPAAWQGLGTPGGAARAMRAKRVDFTENVKSPAREKG